MPESDSTSLKALATVVLTTCQHLQLARRTDSERQQLQARLDETRRLVADLDESMQFLSVARGLELPSETPKSLGSQVASARTKLESTTTAFAQDPSIILDDATFRPLIQTVSAIGGLLDEAATRAWATFRERNSIPRIDAVLPQLRLDPSVRPRLEKLEEQQRVVVELTGLQRPKANRLRDIQALVSDWCATFATIRLVDDPDVLAFLRATPAGAPLHLLSAPVLAWLREHNMERDYVIRAAR